MSLKPSSPYDVTGYGDIGREFDTWHIFFANRASSLKVCNPNMIRAREMLNNKCVWAKV